MNIAKIRKLVSMVQSSGVAEIKIAAGSESVRVSRRIETTPTESLIPADQQIFLHRPIEGSESNQGTSEGPGNELHPIVAPMVGIFRRASSTEDKPMVDIGQRVEAGDVLCIIETLALQTPIKADRAGIVDKVLVECSQPVEYNQVLFLLR